MCEKYLVIVKYVWLRHIELLEWSYLLDEEWGGGHLKDEWLLVGYCPKIDILEDCPILLALLVGYPLVFVY